MTRLLCRMQRGIIFRAERTDRLSLSCLKTYNLRIFAGNHQKNEFIKVGQLLPAGIYFPVVRIALQYDSLARDNLFQAEWTKSGDLVGRRIESPRLTDLSFAVVRL